MAIKMKVLASIIIACTGLNSAWANCQIDAGSVRILSNDIKALHVVARGAEECAGEHVTVTKNQTTEHKSIQVPALRQYPARYTVTMVSTNSFVPLLQMNLIRPLDDYVEKWGGDLQESQLIKIDGKVMGIAFMANAQHLFYRKDILEENNIPVPETYMDLLQAAKTLKERGVMKYPIVSNYKPGWDLGTEFINLYLGTKGAFFKPGTAELAIDNKNAIDVLNMMKRISEYMGPDYLTYTPTTIKPIWDAGEAAFLVGWGSRTSAYLSKDNPSKDIVDSTYFAAAPSMMENSIPAVGLWWDGFTISKNISDEDAEASFKAMVHAISPKRILSKYSDDAVWLVKGYKPKNRSSSGVISDMEKGALPYPMYPYMDILHSAVSANLADFMQGNESMKQALDDINSAYTASAREAGFL